MILCCLNQAEKQTASRLILKVQCVIFVGYTVNCNAIKISLCLYHHFCLLVVFPGEEAVISSYVLSVEEFLGQKSLHKSLK